MSTQDPARQLALAAGLTPRTQQLCLGWSHGAPTFWTGHAHHRELLLWWFGEDMVARAAG
jgi:type III restriction enzyme